MMELRQFQLLGVGPRAVLRVALAEGLRVFEQADHKYFALDAARHLATALEGGISVEPGIWLPAINALDPRVTPRTYSDHLFSRGIVDIHNKNFGDTNNTSLVNIRLPRWLIESRII